MADYESIQKLTKYLSQYGFNSPEECAQRIEEVGRRKDEILDQIGKTMGPYMNRRHSDDPIFRYYNPTLCDIAFAGVKEDSVKLLRGIVKLTIQLQNE